MGAGDKTERQKGGETNMQNDIEAERQKSTYEEMQMQNGRDAERQNAES